MTSIDVVAAVITESTHRAGAPPAASESAHRGATGTAGGPAGPGGAGRASGPGAERAPAGRADPRGAGRADAPGDAEAPARRILICRRRREKAQGGLWEFPGGKVEPGESHARALTREIREELCCGIVPGDFIGMGAHTYPELRVRIHAYRATLSGEVQCFTDHDEVAWIYPPQLQEYALAPADRFLIPLLCETDDALDYGFSRRKQ